MRKLITALLLILSGLFFTSCSSVKESFNEIEESVALTFIGEPKEVESISEGKIVYSSLSDEDKACYDEILDCILRHDEEVSLSVTDEDEVERIYHSVMADNGGLFWLDGYSYSTYTKDGNVFALKFSPSYTFSYEERSKVQAKIDARVDTILGTLDKEATDYEKSKFVYEKLIEIADYDINAKDSQNIISVFIDGQTVCQGYACAATYLLWQLSIPAMTITGVTGDETHAWNALFLDGQYYLMDATWGNGQYYNGADSEKYIDYAFLNTTSEALSSDHVATCGYYVPECSAIEDNYFVREGLYFDEWDEEAIGIAISNGYYNNVSRVSAKFSDASVYQAALSIFFEGGRLADYCEGITRIKYLTNPERGIITVIYD